VFDHRPIVPVLGNHEYQAKAALYLAQFALPRNAPDHPPSAPTPSVQQCQVHLLDSNLDAAKQTAWLGTAKTKAMWKFVTTIIRRIPRRQPH
jgi:hypothetical protein